MDAVPVAQPTSAESVPNQKPFGGKRWSGSKKGRKKCPPLLGDYRWVYNNPTAETKRHGRKALQKLLVEDAKGFLQQMREQERAWGMARLGRSARQEEAKADEESAPGTSPEPEDEGTEAAVGVVRKWLEGWEGANEK